MILALCVTTVPAFATNTAVMTNTEYKTALSEIDKLLEQDTSSEEGTLSFMEDAVGQNDMMKIMGNYNNAFPKKEDADKMIKDNLKSTYKEIKMNNFSKDQAKALFLSAANLETGNAVLSKMSFSADIPDFAPSHNENSKVNLTTQSSQATDIPMMQSSLSTTSITDCSTRTSYETGGIGYEVQSTTGYNKTTEFLTADSCNVTATSGKAGYMFNTIYSNGHYQDIGIGYFGGKYKAFVSGYWTNWGTGTVSINAGDYLYFKTWIGADNRIYFQILDGNNFNNIKFQNSYSTSLDPIPSSGSGVNFNRQITLVDTAHNATSGLYLTNASFSQSYLYNNSSTQTFSSTNTTSTRRGKFGCSWASDSKVGGVNTHWGSETINISMV